MREIKLLITHSILIVISSIFLFGCVYPSLSILINSTFSTALPVLGIHSKRSKAPTFEDLVLLVSYQGSELYFTPRPSSWKKDTHKSFFCPEGSVKCLHGHQGGIELAHRAKYLGLSLDKAYDMRYSDMITESASGIDPHISPYNAHFQAERVALHRGIDPAQLHLLIDECTLKSGSWALFPSVVDVIVLNKELDLRFPQK